MHQQLVALAVYPPAQKCAARPSVRLEDERICALRPRTHQHQRVLGAELACHAEQEVVGEAVDMRDLQRATEHELPHGICHRKLSACPAHELCFTHVGFDVHGSASL
ncbi:MAG: hypothetical protein ACK55I_30120, partial [bacterium]